MRKISVPREYKFGPLNYATCGDLSVITFREKSIYERCGNMCFLFGLTFRIW